SMFAKMQLVKGSDAERAGQFDEAAKFYRTGLDAVPNYVPLLRAGGMLALKQSRFADAVDIFRNYIQIEPKDPAGCFMLGKALEGVGQTQEAHEILERGLHLAEGIGNAAMVEEFKRALGR